jgi:hypothetical protein
LEFGAQFGKRLVTGPAAGAVTAAMRGGRISAAQVAADAFGNALGDSLAAANSSIPGPVGAAERAGIMGMFADGPGTNAQQNYANYQQVVGAFSGNDSIDRSNDTLLAAGPGYSGMGMGSSNRDQNIDRMLDLANRSDSGGAWSGMGADGVPRVSFGVFGSGESIRSDDGRGFIDEVRSAAEGPVTMNEGRAVGTPLPPWSTGASQNLPELDRSGYNAPFFTASAYHQATSMMLDGNAPWYDRVIGGVAATAMVPNMLEHAGRRDGSRAAQRALLRSADGTERCRVCTGRHHRGPGDGRPEIREQWCQCFPWCCGIRAGLGEHGCACAHGRGNCTVSVPGGGGYCFGESKLFKAFRI